MKKYLLTGGFFDDFAVMKGGGSERYVREDTIKGVQQFFDVGNSVLTWIWVMLLLFTLVSLVIALVRLSISSDDVPHLKARAKHDFATTLVVLAILGAVPVIAGLLIGFLNMGK